MNARRQLVLLKTFSLFFWVPLGPSGNPTCFKGRASYGSTLLVSTQLSRKRGLRKPSGAVRNRFVRDLLKQPLWNARSMGRPMPDTTHACAVSLPTWDSVIGYEEGRDRVMKKLEAGYPRFFLHPLVKRLFAKATEEIAESGARSPAICRAEAGGGDPNRKLR
jgi:hypothetical protein